MIAKSNTKEGYQFEFCYTCIIKPTGLPSITFAKDNIAVNALPLIELDCS